MICRFAKQYSGPRDEHVAGDVRRSCVDGGRTIEYDVGQKKLPTVSFGCVHHGSVDVLR